MREPGCSIAEVVLVRYGLSTWKWRVEEARSLTRMNRKDEGMVSKFVWNVVKPKLLRMRVK
jgi:hypothetical protein